MCNHYNSLVEFLACHFQKTDNIHTSFTIQISEIKNLNITDSIGKEITVGNEDSNKLKKNEQNIVLEYIDKEAWEKKLSQQLAI